MPLTRTGRLVAVVTTAALLASLSVATLAAPASAAKPKCAGRVATIVGTNKGEVIRGTRKSDVIVAKGGHDIVRGGGGDDIICGNRGNDKLVGGRGNDLLFGQTGRDKHFGGPGRDRLVGGPANDSFNGGTGNDACLQGSGTGPQLNCERPVIAPPPPPATAKVFAIAYSDLDRSFSFGAGDVLIAKFVDTSGDGLPGAGDTIEMGKYPTTFEPAVLGDFEDWQRKTHEVVSATMTAGSLEATTTRGAVHRWSQMDPQEFDAYYESAGTSFTTSSYRDYRSLSFEGVDDVINRETTSPSRPQTFDILLKTSDGDAPFIDVEVNP